MRVYGFLNRLCLCPWGDVTMSLNRSSLRGLFGQIHEYSGNVPSKYGFPGKIWAENTRRGKIYGKLRSERRFQCKVDEENTDLPFKTRKRTAQKIEMAVMNERVNGQKNRDVGRASE